MAWIHKYAPKNLKEFVNQAKAVQQFLAWYKSFKPGGKAALLYGPPGVGKTALVRAFANQNQLALVEMNASDFRTAQKIKQVFGASALQASLFKKGKIFLIDEVDGIAGKEDKGGIGEIIKFLKISRHPVVLTANDAWNPKLKSLRSYCVLIQFMPIASRSIVKRLAEICKKEKIKASKEVLSLLAQRSKGDLRAAINDLETLATKKEITVKDVQELGYREKEEQIFQVLKIIFKTKSIKGARFALSQAEKDPEEIFWWIEENIANEYESLEEIAKAYEFLSLADLFRKRIISRQNWRLIVYMLDFMSSGVAIAKKEMYRKFTKFASPTRLKTYAELKPMKKEVAELLEKLSQKLNCSTKVVKQEYVPLLRILYKNPKLRKSLISYLNTTDSALKSLIS